MVARFYRTRPTKILRIYKASAPSQTLDLLLIKNKTIKMQAVRDEIQAETSPQSSDVNSIQHIVSKSDTLAKLAIKYGVKVADIKQVNGLVTDQQMFALKTVEIPMPWKHLPSPGAVNSPRSTRLYDDAFDSFYSPKLKSPPPKVTPAMSSLQGYYGLTGPSISSSAKSTVKALPGKPVLFSDPQPNQHRRSRSLAVQNFPENINLDNDVTIEIAGESEARMPGSMKAVRRRQKTDADSILGPSELENAESFAARTGKGLSMRETGRISPSPLGDSSRVNMLGTVRKSSSTSNLQETENISSSKWPSSRSMWPLKPEGLPKPNAWRNKAALD